MRPSIIGPGLLCIMVLASMFIFIGSLAAEQSPHVLVNYVPLYDEIAPGDTLFIGVLASIREGYHIHSNKPLEDYLIPTEVTVQLDKAFQVLPSRYPPHKKVKLGFSDDSVVVFEATSPFVIPVVVPMDYKGKEIKGQVVMDYQVCNDEACFPPMKASDDFTVFIGKKRPAGEVPTCFAALLGTDAKAPEPTPVATTPGPDTTKAGAVSDFGKKGLLLTLVIVFLGGLALNLTPCVYPLIPITIGFFTSQRKGSLWHAFLMGWFYVLGMAVTYSALGVIAAISGSMMGAALQNPILMIVISLVMVALGLSSFGLFEIQLPASITNKLGTGSRGGFIGSLVMGLTMGVVAAPCIGPFVLSLLIYVGQQASVSLGFLLFFTLSLGLGLPYLVLATFSGSLSALPRSGAWMLGIKRLFGVLLIGMAWYFLKNVLPPVIVQWGVPLYILGSVIYLVVFEKTWKPWLFRVFKVAAIVGAVVFGVWLIKGEKQSAIIFQPYSDAALASAKQAGKPVFIDFGAAWCIPCKELEHSTFPDPAVGAESQRFVCLKADVTKGDDPAVQALTKTYQISGVPTLVFIESNGQENRVLRETGLIPPQKLVELMRQVK